jgi:trans-2,3-dihydro-3-hydroxyanthranilate isomerase
MRLDIVDVFAEERYAGNQLAVVRGAAGLDGERMQAIAREMNYSETTFVTREDDGAADVRIFTPAQELPFAGHPTIGTAWVLGRQRPSYTLRLAAGDVTVRFDARSGLCWMAPPEPSLNDGFAHERAARVIGLEPDDLDPALPPQFVAVGPEFVFIGVKDLATLRRAKLDEPYHDAMLDEGLPAFAVFLFAPEAYSADADYSARLFFRAPEVREDPATGSANSGLAAYLRHHLGAPVDVIVEQGFEIDRPSRLYLKAEEEILVGGKVQAVAEGTLLST